MSLSAAELALVSAASNLAVSGSNALALAQTNTAQSGYASNAAYYGSNVAGYASNAAVFTPSACNVYLGGAYSNLGIGCNAPAYPLHVSGNASCAYLSAGNLGAFRNRIINGDLRVNQKGSATVINLGTSEGFVTDRWFGQGRGSALLQNGTSNVSVPGYPFTTAVSCYVVTASTSTTSTDFYTPFTQIIEGLNVADLMWGTSGALPVTVSFSLYSTVTAPLFLVLENGNANMSYVVQFTPASANAWARYSFTVPGPTSGTWATNSTAGIVVSICSYAGSSYQGTAGAWAAADHRATSAASTTFNGTTNNTLLLTGVQFEKGTIATPFEFRPQPVELQLCRRYYVRFAPSGSGARGYPLVVACATSGIGDVYYNHGGNYLRTTNSSLTVNINNVTNGYAIGSQSFSYIDGTTVTPYTTSGYSSFLNDEQPFLFRVSGTSLAAGGGCVTVIANNGGTGQYIEISAEM